MHISKVEKFLVCAYLRLESVGENIEGDANFHHPPGIGLKNIESV